MTDVDDLRARLSAAGVDLPADVIPFVAPLLGALIQGLDLLVTLDLGDVDPFVPARQLVDDAAP
ncbi:MAG: hypothetical protein U0807_06770 [Candidatus Binatia bacterium]